MVTIHIDGVKAGCEPGTVLRDLLPGHDWSLSVAVIRPGTTHRSETRQFLLKTSAGEIVIETSGDGIKDWSAIPGNLPVKWEDRLSVSAGTFPGSFTPARRPSRYERGDLILGCGGYDPDRSVLVFSRRTHSADHGAAADGGRVGRVISGKGVMDRLGPGDSVFSIEPVISCAESVDATTTTDDSYPVTDGMQVITHLSIEVQGYAPGGGIVSAEAAESVESLLLALRSGRFVCNQRMSTHIRCDSLAGTAVPYEAGGTRREGAVMMRTSGKNQGSVYIYTEDLPRSLAHTRVGQVVHGVELARIAREGDSFAVRILPVKVDLIGYRLDDAETFAGEQGVALTPDHQGPDRMVIGQDPATTLDVLGAGAVSVTTVPVSQVIDISLDDANAPDSCRIFRELTGLKYHAVGRLPLFFAFDDVYLFQMKIPKTTNVKPENIPEEEVEAGVLAITNESCKGVGLVGVRASDNSEFGPTSEPFSGTNMIGKVVDMEKLGSLKEGDMVFFREVGR